MLKPAMTRSALLALACSLCLSAAAVADATKRAIHIPSGDLATALELLAKQSGSDLVYRPDQVQGFKTGGVDGDLSTEEAVTKLLEGTPFMLSTDATGAMLIALPIASTSTSQVDEFEPNVRGIPEVLVQGSRSINTDIERTEDDAQPYVTFNGNDLRRSQARTVEEFLKTRLPMNTVQGTFSQSSGEMGGTMSQINLRGLGTNQTLVLIDGRRMPGINANGNFLQPDLNGIPLSLIERIEVLPSTASGIYGGGATGGVVNIITRKDVTGAELSGSYGSSFRGDAANYRLEGSVGFSLEEGRTHVLIAASHSDADALFSGDRDFVNRSRAMQLANNPALVYSPMTTVPIGYLPNIRSQDGSDLVLRSGNAPLNSPRTFIPAGYSGIASDNGAALAANAGRYSIEQPDYVLGTQQSAMSANTVSSGSLNLRREFSERVEAYLDGGWSQNKGESFVPSGIPTSVNLAANAPNNPFTRAITVSFPATGLPLYPWSTETQTLRGSGGVIVRLGGNWTAAADYSWSRSRFLASTVTPLGDPDGAGPRLSMTEALRTGVMDVMRDPNALPYDWSPYLLPSPVAKIDPSDTSLRDASLRFSGPVWELPGGAVTLSILGEHRKELADDTFRELINSNAGVASVTYTPGREQTVDSYYVETNIPLFSPVNAKPFLRSLEFQASVRRDEYETTAPSPATVPGLASRDSVLPPLTYVTNGVEANKYTLGLRYMPVQDLTLRASYGTGFLPPSITQLVPNATPSTSNITLIDPKRGGVAAVYNFPRVSGGNPNLSVEESKSWSAGLIVTPRILPDLRLSLDYTRIEKVNEISSVANFPQILLDLEDSFPGRVTRDPLEANAPAGFTAGRITSIDLTLLNFAATQLDAFDAQADYTWRTDGFGTFALYVAATWQPKLDRQSVPAAPLVSLAGFSDGVLKWRGNAGLTWDRGPWSVGWSTQYFDDYLVYSSTSNANSIEQSILTQGSRTVSSQAYHDLLVSYRFDKSGLLPGGVLDGTMIAFGVANVLDTRPAILAGLGTTGGYSRYGDPRMRRYSLTISKSF